MRVASFSAVSFCAGTGKRFGDHLVKQNLVNADFLAAWAMDFIAFRNNFSKALCDSCLVAA